MQSTENGSMVQTKAQIISVCLENNGNSLTVGLEDHSSGRGAKRWGNKTKYLNRGREGRRWRASYLNQNTEGLSEQEQGQPAETTADIAGD